MNNLSHTIRKFNRFELKYLITLKQAEIVKTALRAFLVEDEHGNKNGRYSINSLYYDSPDYRCYWEKMDGVKFRRKLRIRHYEMDNPPTDETPVFIEIKQRLDRVTQKRRAILTYRDALRLCNNRMVSEYPRDDKAVIDEIQALLWEYNLHPTIIVRYERQAFMGTEYDLGLRVTFDTNLTCQTNPLCLDEPPSTLPILPRDTVVMEIKVNERIPYWLTELVGALNLQMVRMSKYCHSVEIANLITHTFSTPFYFPIPNSVLSEK